MRSSAQEPMDGQVVSASSPQRPYQSFYSQSAQRVDTGNRLAPLADRRTQSSPFNMPTSASSSNAVASSPILAPPIPSLSSSAAPKLAAASLLLADKASSKQPPTTPLSTTLAPLASVPTSAPSLTPAASIGSGPNRSAIPQASHSVQLQQLHPQQQLQVQQQPPPQPQQPQPQPQPHPQPTQVARPPTENEWVVVANPAVSSRIKIDLEATFPHHSVVCYVRYSADGRYIATGCNHAAFMYDVTRYAISYFSASFVVVHVL